MITLTREELRALLGSPEAMQVLADHHSAQETMADASDYAECAEWHKRRRLVLRAEAKRLQTIIDQGDEDPRPAIASVPTLHYQD